MTALSVIISTWNCLGHIRKCIDSILALEIQGLEVIVVDSNSTDGTREYLTELSNSKDGSRLGLRLILCTRRIKWSEANQIGLDLSQGKWICLSNPDIIFNAGFETMFQACVDSDIWVAAPQLVSPDGSDQIPKKLVTPRVFFSAYTLTGTLLWRALRHSTPTPLAPYHWRGEESVIVDNPVGSFFMVHRSVLYLLKGKLWNQGYLNGVSDLDAFLNFKRRGIVVRLFPGCRLIHFTSFVTKRSPSWIEYDLSFGMALYFRYWKMAPALSTVLLCIEGFSAVLLEIALKAIKPRQQFFNPKLRAWKAGQRLIGLVDGWRVPLKRT